VADLLHGQSCPGVLISCIDCCIVRLIVGKHIHVRGVKGDGLRLVNVSALRI
jgi:hypothetical protein